MKTGVAVIGTGLWGEMHVKTYLNHPEVDLVAVCDANETRLAEVCDTYGTRGYTDYVEMLEREPEIRAVSVATPDFAHREPALAVARSGKHLLVEKPLATTVEDAEGIIQAAEKAGVKLMVDFHNRWNPPFNLAKADIDAGEIGEPLLVYARLNNTLSVPTEMLSWASRSTTLWFTGSHLIDLVCWLVGDRVTRVYSVARSKVLKGLGLDTPDFFETILEFAEGAVAVVETCWVLPDSEPTVIDFKMQIVGTTGAFQIDPSHSGTIQKYAKRVTYPDVMVMPTVFGRIGGFATESIRYFADAVIHDMPPIGTGQDGLTVTRIVCAAIESAEKRQPVSLR
jgi:predicted dehydrogenase